MNQAPASGASLSGGERIALGYMPGLDGLRALAVVAVILYHAQQSMPSSWLPGGFLGVEVFFVVSGFLITSLLVAEHERTGRIDLRRFWARRARRLLPALFAVLIVTVGVVGLGGRSNESLREHVGAFRGMWVSAWLYVTNWYQIAAGLNYADHTGRAPLLRHLWSLAVEEQFYVVWPLLMWFVLRRFRNRLPAVGLVFAVLAGAIAVVTAVLYEPTNLERINFLYLSTPTRASGLLLGSALAIFWRPWRLSSAPVSLHGHRADALGLVGLGVLVWAFVRWHFVVDGVSDLHGYDVLFRGGFLLIGVATLLVIVAASHPSSVLGRRALAMAPLVWIGKRSYGLYLWHWPVFQLVRPWGDTSLLDPANPDVRLSWIPTLALRLAITVAISELSYRLLETPVRKGLNARSGRMATAAFAAVLVVSIVPVASTFGAEDELAVQAACNRDPSACSTSEGDGPSGSVSAAGADEPEATSGSVALEGEQAVKDTGTVDSEAAIDRSTGVTDPDPSTTETSATPTTVPLTGSATAAPAAAPPYATVPPMAIKPLALGDSVMLGAKRRLEASGIRVDAREGRRFGKAAGLLKQYRALGQVGDVVVLALGGNDNLSAKLIDQILGLVVDVKHVIVVTPQVNGMPREARNHRLLLAAAPRFPNVTIVDWQQLAQSKLRYYWHAKGLTSPSQAYFHRDKIHLAPAGQRYFTELIVKAIIKAVG